MPSNFLVDIEKLTNLLAAEAQFKLDYRMYLSNKRKLLIVEGSTDETFIRKVKDECVDCIVAAKVFNSNKAFRTKPVEQINCKNAIVKIITGISNFPSPFIAYPADIDKWDLYGLVDSDCEEIGVSRPTPRLFVTDTHDLETLLLSTDDDVLQGLEECEVSSEDIRKAYFLAYQLASMRDMLGDYHNELNLQVISCGSRQVQFSAFIEGTHISMPELIAHINTAGCNDLSTSKVKRIYDSIKNSKVGRKRLDDAGCWKQNFDDFSLPSDFWSVVNGHDILQLLLYISEDACLAYADDGGHSLNRNFEMSLIAAYDCTEFCKTLVYDKMSKAGLISKDLSASTSLST